jgi:hypothetical protein
MLVALYGSDIFSGTRQDVGKAYVTATAPFNSTEAPVRESFGSLWRATPGTMRAIVPLEYEYRGGVEMHPALSSARRSQAAVLAVVVAGALPTLAPAAERMPPSRQNILVQKYCAVCHTDAAMNGGLSLEHFDAAQAPPSLTAMLLSKLTGGVSLKTVGDAPSDVSAAAFIDQKMKSGAMGAAGIPLPDKATIDALIQAFAVESAGAMDWSVERSKDVAASAREVTVSALREMPSAKNPWEAETYRLIASCNSATQDGYLQLAWSPVPHSGTLAASVDGKAEAQFRVEGSEKMGNGSGAVLHGLAALVLAETKHGVSRTGLPFPAESLTITDLFPGETVTFSFANVPKDTRHEFKTCFPDADSSDGSASSGSQPHARPPSFEVASVKPSDPNRPSLQLHIGTGSLRIGDRVVGLIMLAFNADPLTVAGVPAWAETERYDIAAKGDPSADPDQIKLMLQSLLAERFQLKWHRENKAVTGYDLIVDQKKGMLAKESAESTQGMQPKGATAGMARVAPLIIDGAALRRMARA